jgi:hypothetical protein
LQLQAEDLDERNVAELRKFDAAVALEILEHYSQADFSTVRNRRAYLAGAAEFTQCFVLCLMRYARLSVMPCTALYLCMFALARPAEGC